MSSVAPLVQYPIPCPECSFYTSNPASVLLQSKTFECRRCQHQQTLNEKQLATLKKTVSHLQNCGLHQTSTNALIDSENAASESLT
ncbi:hypothetical protein [Thalassolituus sp.]|mgnify:CR=1|jgi:transcription elongation factor Elf1|uniref:hypothetical protein n=1 Tax=Thalassolituus sp. TaxID=2030822 RepID=UPI002A8162C9|nr:hypothetical protein [Thalassolituus sp.]|tara:strand:+ start:95 stop:352 length:258 start_codon:yes stop_codon:yes gene_type:complete